MLDINRTLQLNTAVVRDITVNGVHKTVYQSRTKSTLNALVKDVKRNIKEVGNKDLIEFSEITKGLKTKNWYLQITQHSSDIPF